MTSQREWLPRQPAVIATVASPQDADAALAAGADALDLAGAALPEAILARHPAAPVWQGSPEPVDCDGVAACVPAIVAMAAIAAWRGAPAVRTREVRAVRRAVDMTAAIRGDRLPACTVRGLA
jgi:hypothetical protein